MRPALNETWKCKVQGRLRENVLTRHGGEVLMEEAALKLKVYRPVGFDWPLGPRAIISQSIEVQTAVCM